MVVFPRTLTRFDPLDQEAGPQLAPPSGAHPMGTDNLSRDVLSRMIYGSQTILGVAFAAAHPVLAHRHPAGAAVGLPGGAWTGCCR